MISAGNFLFFFIGLETASIPMATLVAFDKYRHKSAEAGAKYILNAVFTSGLSLYGMSLLYGTTGTLYFDDIPATVTGSPLQIMAFVFFAVGLFFQRFRSCRSISGRRMSTKAPRRRFTSYLSVISKGSAVFVLMTILIKVFAPIAAQWQGIRYGVIVVTITLANLFAIRQKNLKRFLAYSSISQAGYIMLGVIGGTALGMTSLVYYVLVYMVSNLAAFGVIGVIENRTGKLTIADYNGLYATHPKLSLCDDAGYVLAGRNTAFRGLLQQVLHLRRSRPAGLLYSGADRAAQYDHFARRLSATSSRRCSSTKTIRRSSRSAATAIRA